MCHIILPPNAPIHEISSIPQSSMEAAKKEASLRAIETLHRMGSLNDFLLPHREKPNKEEVDLINCVPQRGEGKVSSYPCEAMMKSLVIHLCIVKFE